MHDEFGGESSAGYDACCSVSPLTVSRLPLFPITSNLLITSPKLTKSLQTWRPRRLHQIHRRRCRCSERRQRRSRRNRLIDRRRRHRFPLYSRRSRWETRWQEAARAAGTAAGTAAGGREEDGEDEWGAQLSIRGEGLYRVGLRGGRGQGPLECWEGKGRWAVCILVVGLE